MRTTHWTFSFLLLLVSLSIKSQSLIHFSDSTISDALQRAKAQHKPVMFFCYANWCGHCQYMEEKVFTDKKVADFYNRTFVCGKYDIGQPNGKAYAKALHIHSFPTTIYLSADSTVLSRVEGENSCENFIREGKNALTPELQLPYLKKTFEKDVSNSINCDKYLTALKRGGLYYKDVVNVYFNTQTEAQLLSAINWKIFTNGVSDLDSRLFQFVNKHRDEYCKIASVDKLRHKFVADVNYALSPLVNKLDTTAYKLKRSSALNLHYFSTDSLVFCFDLQIQEMTQNWPEYRSLCVNGGVKNYFWNNFTQLSEVADKFNRYIRDQEGLSIASQWIKRALDLSKSYNSYLTAAYLEKKLGRRSESLDLAQEAIRIAKKYKRESQEAEKLVKELQQ